jgi:hypothetical protein
VADTIKVLGQYANPTSEQVLYTVPTLVQTTVSSLIICNRTAGDLTFRVYISKAGVATADEQYLFYDTKLAGNSTLAAVLGLTLEETDEVRILGSATGLTFNMFGVETV